MGKKKVLFKKIYSITILMMLFTTALAGMQVMASTGSYEGKVHWKSNTKDEEIQVPDGVRGDGGKWESQTYTSSDDETNNTSIDTKPMSTGEEYGAILAGLVGVLALSAAKNASTSNESVPKVSEGNGIWVPESDKDAVIKMINNAASKKYFIDSNGFVKEVVGAVEDPSKSSTYSSVLDRLINGENKVVIGVNDGWVSSGENGLQANVFTGNNSGITIGDNGTPQVVIVSGKDMPDSSADITLAHELTHALRGEEGIKSINTVGGLNKDEEAHTIEVENKIRKELGYTVRKDGDNSDGGDGSYGKYNDTSKEKDWYSNIDKMQASEKLSGNAYANLSAGSIAIASTVVRAAASIISSKPSSSSSSHRSRHRKKSSSNSSSSTHSSRRRNSSRNTSSSSNTSISSTISKFIPKWGSKYDDSVWRSVGSVVGSVVDKTANWKSNSKPKWNWDTFWNTTNNRLGEENKKTLSKIVTVITTYASKIIPTPIVTVPIITTLEAVKQYFKPSVKIKSGWEKDNNGNWYYYENGQKKTGWILYEGKWYYLNNKGKMQNGWVEDKGKWYYLDESGKMQNGWVKDKDKWYYLNDKGEMETGWKKYNDKWYYLNDKGEMETGWKKDNDKWYYLYSEGEMAKNQWVKGKDDKWCYLDSSGVMQIGWIEYNGNWYYSDEKGEMETGWLNKDGNWYYLYNEGQMAKNQWIKGKDDKWCYLDSSGVMKIGWIEYNGNWYYSDEKGKMETGWLNKDSNWYYLYNEGQMAKNQWIKGNDNEWYYFAEDGAMKKGWINDNGDYYYLYDENILAKGWMQQGDKWYYLDNSGKMQSGWQNIDGEEYYFYSDGTMGRNWTKVGDDWYYLGDSGKVQSGWQNIDGKDYYFDEHSGEMLKDMWFEDDNGNLYNFLSNGRIYEQIIWKNGKKHYYNSRGEELDDGKVNFSLGKLIVTNWERRIGNYTYYNETIMIAHGVDPELAKAGAEVITGELCGNLLGVTINGVKAFVNIRTGEIVYENSAVAGSGAGGGKVIAKGAAEGAAEAVVNLSKNDIKHVLNRHSYNNVSNEVQYLLKKYPQQRVEELLDRGFFNKNWSNEQISQSIEKGYNQLLKEGKEAGEFVVKIDNEDITMVLSGNGKFETAWGQYKYTLKDFVN